MNDLPPAALRTRSYKLILLDTEGIDAYDQTGARTLQIAPSPLACAMPLGPSGCQSLTRTALRCAGQYSTQIFALAVLLSSLFVYNQLGAIDEAALDRLALVSEVSRSLAGKAAGAKPAAGAEADVARFAPSFLWLLRDFYLDLRQVGPFAERFASSLALTLSLLPLQRGRARHHAARVPGGGAAAGARRRRRR